MADSYPYTPTQLAEVLTSMQQEQSKKIQNGFLMLRANYEADDMEISASRPGRAAGYDNFNTANEQYGSFAHRICDELSYQPQQRSDGSLIWTYVLCEASKEKDKHLHFQWQLRPQVAQALESMGLVNPASKSDLLTDLAAKEENLANYSEKDREAIVKARIGQGEFRKRLIKFWDGCSVTGCDCFEILIASHIKPWRDCIGKEAIDQMNGLLLLPNLDKAFDRGLISFDESGKIIYSNQLGDDLATTLGIHRDMQLRNIMDYHQQYLRHHRDHVLIKSNF